MSRGRVVLGASYPDTVCGDNIHAFSRSLQIHYAFKKHVCFSINSKDDLFCENNIWSFERVFGMYLFDSFVKMLHELIYEC